MPLSRSSSFSSSSKLRRSFSLKFNSSFHRSPFIRTKNPRPVFQLSCISPKVSKREPLHWLNVLPDDVCERIAAHLGRGQPNPDLLNLARTSKKLKYAVIASLNYELTFARTQSDYVINGFAELMREDVVQVDITQVKTRRVTWLLDSCHLRTAKISDWRGHIYSVAMHLNIRELELRIEALSSRKVLLRTLASLCLEKLIINCQHNRPGRCPMTNPETFGLACPNLVSLATYCKCHPENTSPWRVLPYLPHVQELELRQELPTKWINFVSSMQNVKLSGNAAYLNAIALGTTVSELNILDAPMALDARELKQLRHCSLTVFRARLVQGAEKGLPEFCFGSNNLHSLELRWTCKRHEPPRCKYYGVCYSKVPPGLFLNITDLLPLITELKLFEVRIPVSELISILLKVGNRMRTFGTSIAHQDEMPFERLRILVDAATEWNNELREFLISESMPVFPFRKYMLVGRRDTLREMADEGNELRTCVELLKTRSPFLQSRSLDSIVRLLVNSQFHLVADNDCVRVDPVTKW